MSAPRDILCNSGHEFKRAKTGVAPPDPSGGMTWLSPDHVPQTARSGARPASFPHPSLAQAHRITAGPQPCGGAPDSATLRPVEDYTNKYKGEQVEVALFGGEYQEGVLTAYCSIEEVPHVELNGHILIPLQNVASVHCSSRCDAPEPDWPPRGLTEDDVGEA